MPAEQHAQHGRLRSQVRASHPHFLPAVGRLALFGPALFALAWVGTERGTRFAAAVALWLHLFLITGDPSVKWAGTGASPESSCKAAICLPRVRQMSSAASKPMQSPCEVSRLCSRQW